MGRVSQVQARENRRHVVEVAARLFRERGVPGVSVADLMSAAGLTHGGFYKQFESKDALVAEAVGKAFDQLSGRLVALDDRGPDHAAARRALIEYYLSGAHRDDPGDGCAAAGFCVDVAREDEDGAARDVYAEGVEDFGRWLAGNGDEDLAALSTLVGALLLARATRGHDVSDRILTAATDALIER
jgi:TetR/AcrR family transcriptional regulator, transcriptional repressor for nem operon